MYTLGVRQPGRTAVRARTDRVTRDGFTGLSRLMLTYIQLSMAILPIFVLITTVRSLAAGDREAGVFEYLLALPVPLGAWYWGKLAGVS